MTFKELKIGTKFNIVRLNDNKLVYKKINDRPHYNTTIHKEKVSIHKLTQVKEVK